MMMTSSHWWQVFQQFLRTKHYLKDFTQMYLSSIEQHVRERSVSTLSSVQFSRVWLFATPRIAARQASLSITNTWSSLRLTCIESVMPSSHLTSVVPFSSCPQSFPASESFLMSQLFTWGGQNTGLSALESFLPNKSQSWSPLEWTGWISLQCQGTLKSHLQHHNSKSVNSSALSFLHSSTLTSIHDHWKNHSLD